MQTLDRLLYAWLSERDDARFQRAFGVYFQTAFPAIVRYLARRAAFDQSQLEDLAQETLLKFFDRIGVRRRQAFATTADSLPRVCPLNLGAFHERQVSAWKGGVSAYAADAMDFAARAGELTGTPDWKSMLREVCDRAPGLVQQGCHLLNAVHCTHDVEFSQLRDFWQRLEAAAGERTSQALEAEAEHPGVMQFLRATCLVTEAVPELRIPTNGYLFEIALSSYLDECKHRGRKKRGGSGVLTDSDNSGEPHFLNSEESEALGEDFVNEEHRVGMNGGFAPAAQRQGWGADPDLTYETQQFLERFYDYLRRPVDEAQLAYEQAPTPASAKAARRKLESLTQKFARLSAVLSLLGEGYTQETIAEQLALSRNQVKYVIECVQESYAKFCGRAAQQESQSTAAEEPTHVK